MQGKNVLLMTLQLILVPKMAHLFCNKKFKDVNAPTMLSGDIGIQSLEPHSKTHVCVCSVHANVSRGLHSAGIFVLFAQHEREKQLT